MEGSKAARSLVMVLVLLGGACSSLDESPSAEAKRRRNAWYNWVEFDAAGERLVISLPREFAGGDVVSTRVAVEDEHGNMFVDARPDLALPTHQVRVGKDTTRVQDAFFQFTVPEGATSIHLEFLDPEGAVLASEGLPVRQPPSLDPNTASRTSNASFRVEQVSHFIFTPSVRVVAA